MRVIWLPGVGVLKLAGGDALPDSEPFILEFAAIARGAAPDARASAGQTHDDARGRARPDAADLDLLIRPAARVLQAGRPELHPAPDPLPAAGADSHRDEELVPTLVGRVGLPVAPPDRRDPRADGPLDEARVAGGDD